MTFRQAAIVYCQTYKIHIRNTLSRVQKFLILKQVVHKVQSVL
jgi:hypothetical protein